MVKTLKNNISKIIIAITLMLTLIGITFLSTKTYAYTIDNNGNLVGNNLLNLENYSNIENATINNQQIIFNTPNNTYGDIRIGLGNSSTINTWLFIGINEDDESYQYTTFNIDSNNYQLYIRYNGNAQDGNVYYNLDTFNNGTYTISFNYIYSTTNSIILKLMLNEGSTPQEWEPYGVWYSEFNYDTLENNYKELYNYNKYGWLKYIDNLDLSIGGTFIEEYNFNQLVSNNYISNNKINVYDLTRISNPNYTYSNIEIYFNDSINNKDTFSYNLFSLTSNGDYASSIVSIYDDEDHVATFEFSNELVSITPEAIINKNKLFNGNIYNITIYNSSPDSAINYYTDSMYGNGYQSGYNYGRTIADSIERELNNKIKEKDNQIQQLKIEKQQAYNNGYTTGYNEGNTNSNGLYNMVIAVADTPISIFKQIFNFNILGLDISGFIFGIISLLIIVWLIKKII